MPIQPLRVRRSGDSEWWSVIAMFKASQFEDEDQLREEFGYGDSGPGQPFANRPTIVTKGRFVFVHQTGGLDV